MLAPWVNAADYDVSRDLLVLFAGERLTARVTARVAASVLCHRRHYCFKCGSERESEREAAMVAV